METDPVIPDRLKAGSFGLGEPDTSEIEKRAVELAMIDGRESFTDADLAQARVELSGGTSEPIAPEEEIAAATDLTTWDEPVDQDGHRSERVPLEDEISAPEQLIRDGLDEADHDLRVAAAEEMDAEEVEE